MDTRALVARLRQLATLRELHGAPDARDLTAQLEALLQTLHTHSPASPARPRTGALRVVHWNVEHGNAFPAILAALQYHPALRDPDLLTLNEVDLGMARSGNRDVALELARAMGMYLVWAPMFLETTAGRFDDLARAGNSPNREGLFGIALLSRYPLSRPRAVRLPGPHDYHYDVEGMFGHHVGLLATVEHPRGAFTLATSHLEVHRGPRERGAQVATLLRHLPPGPTLLTGDFNTHTFERGRAWDSARFALTLLGSPAPALRRRLSRPDRGAHAEQLFHELRKSGFHWEEWNDFESTLGLRLERIREAAPLSRLALPGLGWAGRRLAQRGRLRLDWMLARQLRASSAATIHGLDGPGGASDHAPISAMFEP